MAMIEPLVGPKQWLAARWLSKSTCEGDVPPLDLPKSNTDCLPNKWLKATDPLTGNKSLCGVQVSSHVPKAD
jgi:hypothetical protein